MMASGFIRNPKLMVKASKWTHVRDRCSWAGGSFWNIWVKMRQLQTNEINIPEMAIRELAALELREKRVIRTQAASGAKKAIQMR
jgi:hypothetical protein